MSRLVHFFSTASCTPLLFTKQPPKRKNIIGLLKSEITEEIKKIGLAGFRSGQIFNWIYVRGAKSFQEMKNISMHDRQTLENHFEFTFGDLLKEQISKDGTRKWGIRFPKAQVESVYIPEKGEESNSGTLCFSSQYGCSLTCSFCATGAMPKTNLRNLACEEIVGQIMTAKSQLGDFTDLSTTKQPKITNLVGMGMGEPSYNWKSVSKAMEILMDPDGVGLSKRRITISTSGVVPVLEKIADLGVNLAVSLHAPRNDLRDILVPINKTFPLEVLMPACRDFANNVRGRSRKIGFEYTLLANVNDSDADARELAKICRGFPCMVNLLAFNPFPGTSYETPSPEKIARFKSILESLDVVAVVRIPRGRDIDGACGQLANRISITNQSENEKNLLDI